MVSALGKAHMRSTPSQKFPQCRLWNSSKVRLTAWWCPSLDWGSNHCVYIIIQIVVIETGCSTKSTRGGGQYCPRYWFNKFIKKTRNIHIVLNKTITACCLCVKSTVTVYLIHCQLLWRRCSWSSHMYQCATVLNALRLWTIFAYHSYRTLVYIYSELLP